MVDQERKNADQPHKYIVIGWAGYAGDAGPQDAEMAHGDKELYQLLTRQHGDNLAMLPKENIKVTPRMVMQEVQHLLGVYEDGYIQVLFQNWQDAYQQGTTDEWLPIHYEDLSRLLYEQAAAVWEIDLPIS